MYNLAIETLKNWATLFNLLIDEQRHGELEEVNSNLKIKLQRIYRESNQNLFNLLEESEKLLGIKANGYIAGALSCAIEESPTFKKEMIFALSRHTPQDISKIENFIKNDIEQHKAKQNHKAKILPFTKERLN